MKTYTVPASTIVALIFTKMCATKSPRSGTYDAVDPTSYIKSDCFVELNNDPIWDNNTRDCSTPILIHLKMSNVTWGTDVSVRLHDVFGSVPDPNSQIQFYLNHESGDILPYGKSSGKQIYDTLLALAFDTEAKWIQRPGGFNNGN